MFSQTTYLNNSQPLAPPVLLPHRSCPRVSGDRTEARAGPGSLCHDGLHQCLSAQTSVRSKPPPGSWPRLLRPPATSFPGLLGSWLRLQGGQENEKTGMLLGFCGDTLLYGAFFLRVNELLATK